MRKIGKKRREEQSAAGQMRFPFRGLAREALWDTVILSNPGSYVQSDPAGAYESPFLGIAVQSETVG